MDSNAVEELPENAIDISHMRNPVTLLDIDEDTEFAMFEGIPRVDDMLDGLQTTSFASRLPSAPREIEIISAWANNPNSDESNANEELTNVLNWPGIGSSLINKYNTVGLFDMAFPSLFPKGEADWLQPRRRNVHLHEYAKHLLKYHDNRFGRHPCFRYFLLNIIMRHHAQASSTVFVKKNISELPTTMEELRQHLKNLLRYRDNKFGRHPWLQIFFTKYHNETSCSKFLNSFFQKKY